MNDNSLKKRWVILEHRISKDTIQGRHFDLLLEEQQTCRTWRLEDVPEVNGPPVGAIAIESHKLVWLERKEAFISGGRGWAKQVKKGFYEGSIPKNSASLMSIKIYSHKISAMLELSQQTCRVFSL